MKKSTHRSEDKRRRRPQAGPVQPFGEQVVESLRELVGALDRGEKLHERFTIRTVDADLKPRDFTPSHIRALRNRLMTSQAVFARLLAVSVRTVQAWERGTPPSPMARRLLETIDRDPRAWLRLFQEPGTTRRRAG